MMDCEYQISLCGMANSLQLAAQEGKLMETFFSCVGVFSFYALFFQLGVLCIKQEREYTTAQQWIKISLALVPLLPLVVWIITEKKRMKVYEETGRYHDGWI